MKQTIRSIEPFSLGKILSIVYAGLGLIVGAVVSLVSLLGFLGSLAGGDRGALGLLFGVGSVIFFPLLYAILGMIGGLIAGLLFNLAARVTGGLVIELD